MTATTRVPGVPSLVWGHQQVEEVVEQTTGCIRCLVSGTYETPSIVFFVNGTSLCRAHALEGH